jgi:acylphosphatase
MSELAHLSALVHGHVQGVYFRAFISRAARSLGITGYVRNVSSSGDVEIEAEGERSGLEQMLKAMEKGPDGASVENVDLKWSGYTGDYPRFDVRY